MAKCALDLLIAVERETDSEARRQLLRQVTDSLMVAPDRYGRRDTAVFDLLMSRTASAMDVQVRRLLTLTLVRAGTSEADANRLFAGAPSPNERILRRSVTQTVPDLFQLLKENTPASTLDPTAELEPGHALQLPNPLADWIYQFQVDTYIRHAVPTIGEERGALLSRTAERIRPSIVESALLSAREAIVDARRKIRDMARAQTLTDEVLAELLDARAMTEFIFAGMTMFDIDAATMLRILNDTSFASLAIVMRAGGVRRSVFAKTIQGFRYRRTDHAAADRILPLYDQVSRESAERAIRFWRLRVKELSGPEQGQVMAPGLQPPVSSVA